jgi:outer membrane protein assembly factor BamB
MRIRNNRGCVLDKTSYVRNSLVVAALLVAGCAILRIERTFKTREIDWITFGGTSARTNKSLSSAVPPLKELWQYNTESGLAATPLIRDSVLLMCTLKGELHAVNITNGKRMGYVILEGPVAGTPVWNGGLIYIPISSEKSGLESFVLESGTKDWSHKLGACESSPLLYEKNLYVTSLDGILYCLTASNGNEVWKFKTDIDQRRKPVRSSPATDGEIIVFGCDDGGVYAVERATGKLHWKFQTEQSIFATPVVSKNRVIIGSLDGKLYCLDIRAGKLLWAFDTKSRIFGGASTDDHSAFVGTTDGHCYAVSLETGAVIWNFKAKSIFNSAPLVAQDLLYIGSLDKNLYVLRTQNGEKVWELPAEGRIKVSPVIWGGILFVTSEDSYVTAYK